MTLTCGSSQATNYATEQNISNLLRQSLPEQEIVWLDIKNKPKVFALFKESEQKQTRGAAIILHDYNANPDWQEIIQPLRYYLPKFAWATLSIQMPTLPEEQNQAYLDDLYQQTAQRIIRGIEYLDQKNSIHKVIIAHGMAANMAVKFTADPANQNRLDSIVFISAYDQELLKSSEFIKDISINMLDVFAENDWDIVLASSKKRLAAANLAQGSAPPPGGLVKSEKVKNLILNKTGNLQYRQEIITGANHTFEKQTDELLKVIRGWMERYHKK